MATSRVAVDHDTSTHQRLRLLILILKAETNIGWKPRVSFDQLVEKLAQADLIEAKREKLIRESE